MPKTIPPQITEFFEGVAVCTLCTLINIALSRYGTDPASLFLVAYFTFLFITDTGLTILALALTYPLVRRREK
jgi:hypothetical protein